MGHTKCATHHGKHFIWIISLNVHSDYKNGTVIIPNLEIKELRVWKIG